MHAYLQGSSWKRAANIVISENFTASVLVLGSGGATGDTCTDNCTTGFNDDTWWLFTEG